MKGVTGDSARLAPSFLPSTVILELTYRCNHSCLFCSCPWYREPSRYPMHVELEPSQWKSLISRLCARGVTHIAFSGGEPLLKEDVANIISFASTCQSEYIEEIEGKLMSRSAPPRLSLLTNGRILDRQMLEIMKSHSVHLSLSLPGLRTFNEHTGGGDVDRVLFLLSEARHLGISINIGVTVTRKNIHELYETLSEAILAGADSILLNRFLPGGRGLSNAQDLSLCREEVKEMLDIAEEVLITANRTGIVGTAIPACLAQGSDYRSLQVGSHCAAAIDFFVIDPSGYIRVCNHSETRLGHCSEIESLSSHEYWKHFIIKDYLPDECRDCTTDHHCDGGCREAAQIVGGSLWAKDPLFNGL
jgi:radical SAM protein with 4Fe4S-binding SPASM domain